MRRNNDAMMSRRAGTLRLRRARAAGSAMIETAIIMPLYLTILLGIVYFGYATLSKQRQTVAAGYAAWHGGVQSADGVLNEFWPWEGSASLQWARGNDSLAKAGETELLMSEQTLQGDEFYRTGRVPCQLVAGLGSLGGGGDDCFDRERLAVSLWNYALGEMIQYFEWVPGQGAVERTRINWDDASRYLNENSPSGTGFIAADAANPPNIGLYENLVASSLNGPGADHWFERRAAKIEATYRPWYFRQVVAVENAPPSGFLTYIGGAYPEPLFEPTATTSLDLTRRGTGARFAVGEGGTSSQDLIDNMAGFLQRSALPAADAMDNTPVLGSDTLKDLWEAK